MASNIQNQILTKLLKTKGLKYGEIKWKGVSNDLFNYHLQFLVKKGLIDKKDETYSLSTLGVKHVADEYPINPKGEVANLFKINVITIVSRKGKNGLEILNQTRARHPSFNKKGVMGGSIKRGENILDAAKRKLKEETGLIADFILLGNERRIQYANEEIFSDILFYICYSTKTKGSLTEKTEFGKNEWVSIDEAIDNESEESDSIVSIKKVLLSIKKGKLNRSPVFFKETVQYNTL